MSEPCIDVEHIMNQIIWSTETFGPGTRTQGVINHIHEELDEVLEDPGDVTEWADVIILAIDGAWRAGHSPLEIIEAVKRKQAINEKRVWPDWRKFTEGVAINHERQGDL